MFMTVREIPIWHVFVLESPISFMFSFSAKLFNNWTTERSPDGETYLGFDKTFKYIIV